MTTEGGERKLLQDAVYLLRKAARVLEAEAKENTRDLGTLNLDVREARFAHVETLLDASLTRLLSLDGWKASLRR